ncbi:MAG: hypothetical protein JW944_04160 [Deltaproteobacteria bacterium]|nr:hypothetical protein [Deltaproteobacteria bacterium]
MEVDVDIICSWCSKHLGRKKFLTDDIQNKHRVSHSICSNCRDKLMDEYKKALGSHTRRHA